MELIIIGGLCALVILWLIAEFYADWQFNRDIADAERMRRKYQGENGADDAQRNR